jgi:hypothetical protein
VVPGSGTGFRPFTSATVKTNRSLGRFPDGADTDSNCSDFLLQNTTTLLAQSAAGSDNIKVASVAGFGNGQKIIIDTGTNSEIVAIATIGTAGGTSLSAATKVGVKVIPVVSVEGFGTGQTIIIDSGVNSESAVIATITAARRRFGTNSTNPVDSITFTMTLQYEHSLGAQVSGSGITLTSPVTRAHDSGTQVASDVPTPGKTNQYFRKPL